MDTQNQAPVNGGFYCFSATDSRVQEEDRANQLYDSEEESDSEDGIDVDASTEPKENNSYRGDTDDESVLQRDDYQCSEKDRFQNESQVRELYLESQKQRSRIVLEELHMANIGVRPGNFFETKEDEAKTFVLGMVMAKGSEFNNGMTFSQLESVFNQEVANRQHEALDINLDDLIRSFLGDPAEVANCLRDKENFFKNSMFKDVLSYDQGLGTFKPRYPKNCLQELHKHIQADYEKKKQKREERRGKKEPNAEEGSKLQYMVSCNFLMNLILEVGNDRREKKFSWDYVRLHYEAMFNEDSLCHPIYKIYKEHLQLDNYKILNKTTCRDLFGRSGALKFLSSSVFAEKIGYINPGAESGNQVGQIQVYLKSNQLYTNQELKEAKAKIRELEEKRKKESDKIKKRQPVEESSTVQAAPTSSQMPTPWNRKILEKKAKQVAERLEREKTFVKTELKEDGEPLKLEKTFSFGNFGPPKKPVELAPEKEKLPFKHPTPADSRSQSPPERRPQDRDSDSDTEKRVKEVLYTDDEEEQGKRTDTKVPSKKEEKEPQRTGSSSQHPQVPVQKAAHYFEKTEEEIRQWNERAAAEKNKRPMEDKATDSGSEEELREEHGRYSDDEDKPFKEREFRKNKDRRRDSQTSSSEDPHRRSDPCQKARNIFEKDEEEEEEIRGQSVKWNRPAPEETRNEKERRVEAYARDSQRYRANSDEIKEKESEVKPEIVEGPPNIRSRGDPNNLVNHRPQMPNEKNALHTYMQKSLEEKIRDERDSEEAQRKLRIWQNHEEIKRQKAEQEAAQKEADRQRKLQEKQAEEDKKVADVKETLRLKRLNEERIMREALEANRRQVEEEEKERQRLVAQRYQNSSQDEMFNRHRRRQGSESESGRFPSPDGYQGKPYSIFDQPRPMNERQELGKDGQRGSGFHDGQREGPGQRHGHSQSQWNERHPQSAYQDGHRQGQEQSKRIEYQSPWNEGQGQSDHWNERHGQASFVTGSEQSKRIERPMRPNSMLPDQRRGSFQSQGFEASQIPFNRGPEPGSRQGFGPEDQGKGGGFQKQNRENFDTSPTPSFQSKHSDHGFNHQNSGSPRPCQWQPSRQVSPPQRYGYNRGDFSDTESEYDHRRDLPLRRRDFPSGYEHGFEPYRPAYHQHHQKQDQYRQDQYSQRGFQNVPTGSQNEGGYRQGPSRENTMFHPQSNQGSYYGGDGGSRTSSVTGDYPGRGPISYSNVDRSEDRKNFIGFIVLYLKMDKNMPNNKTRWSYIQTVISRDYRNPAEIFERADWWNAITEENDQITINFQPKTGDVLFALDV